MSHWVRIKLTHSKILISKRPAMGCMHTIASREDMEYEVRDIRLLDPIGFKADNNLHHL